MKKLILILAGIGMAASVFATGNEGVNPPQTGVTTFTQAGGLIVTNTFAFPFQTAPLALLSPSSTNTFTWATTTTNLIITSGGGSAVTNYTVNYAVFVGGTRMQSGTNAVTAGVLLTNVFTYPYALIPSVVVSGTSTNTTGVVAVTSVSTTNFVEESTTTQNASWISV